MKKSVSQASDKRLLREFPLANVVPGWFFRVREISPGAYRVDGTDAWNRRVSRTGSDRDATLKLCEVDARAIQSQVDAHE